MPSELPKQIEFIVAAFASEFQRQAQQWVKVRTPANFLAMERAVASLGQQLSDMVTAVILKAIVLDPVFQAEVTAAAYDGLVPYRSGGTNSVSVTLLGGTETRVQVAYLKRDRRRQPGRKRKGRGKGGSGLYPALAALGIWHGVSPALAEDVAYQVTSSDAVRPAREALARRGIDLGQGRTLRIVNQVGLRACKQRQQWLADARQQPAVNGGQLAGMKAVVTTDGGRMRLRETKRGRRRNSGYHGYHTPWREPKLMAIYIIGPEGKLWRQFQPIYDGTLGDADAIFDMIVGYLRALGAHQAAELVLVGDGAHWIWNRAASLVRQVGIAPERVTEVIDWYHALETIHEISKTPAKWSKQRRQCWVRRARKLLWQGRIEKLLAYIDQLAVGRRAKAIKKHRNYFANNAHRMQYKVFEAAGIPIGSGIIESAIRRIVNMRLKSAAKFWEDKNGEHMLMLRSYLKANRWHSLISWSLAAAVPWWTPAQMDRVSPLRSPATSTQKSREDATCYA